MGDSRKHVLVAGGTGDIGVALVGRLRGAGHRVTVLTRDVSRAAGEAISWGDAGLEELAGGVDAIVNLAGESIWTGRWTRRKKRVIRESRREILRRLAALAGGMKRGGVFVNASAIGYYGCLESREIGDEHCAAGEGFMGEICREGEEIAEGAGGVRVVQLRIGIALSRGGKAIGEMSKMARLRVRGVGSGRQWFSWIHMTDLVEMMVFVMEWEGMSGAYHATAPGVVGFEEAMRLVAARVGRRGWFWAPGWVAKLWMGEAAAMVLEGNRVLPGRVVGEGFEFRYEGLEGALGDLMG